MNIIKRIRIENIKGKDLLEISFNDLVANQPNIIVAPNGYGKSTITKAFELSKSGKINIDINDMYCKNKNNHPKLEVELIGDYEGVYVATQDENNISRNISIGVINSRLYAKSTAKQINGRLIPNADLRVEDVVIYKDIPERTEIVYSFNDFKKDFGEKGKLFLNISKMLSDRENVGRILEIKDCIYKCMSQVGLKRRFFDFLNNCSSSGSVNKIKNAISSESIDDLRRNENVNVLFDNIDRMNCKPDNWLPVDVVFTAIQLCKVLSNNCSGNWNDFIRKVYNYLEYKEVKSAIDERLSDFNTTGRDIKTHETDGKLIVRFERAESMSNGERDILSFIVDMERFKIIFKKKVGILIIDDVFDFLDGCNMLAVQYYLVELLKSCKAKGKVLFPVIFTHLDPIAFSNYYFKKKKIHYVSFPFRLDLETDVVKMLRLRECKSLCDTEKQEIEKYYLHYIEGTYSLSEGLAKRLDEEFVCDNVSFRRMLYDEVENKYLLELSCDSIAVIAGLRIKIEEIVYKKLAVEHRSGYIEQHKVINKLNYAVGRGVDVPELFFLLQPLYNDGLHLGGNDEDVIRKIKSSYLKTHNMHIRKMIEKVFCMGNC